MQAISREDVVGLLRAKQGSRSLRVFGATFKCSAAYISDIYLGRRQPGPKVLEFLGLTHTKQTTVTYTKKRATR